MGYFERDGSRTLRRQLRSSLRGAIGTSSDESPNAERAIRAAGYLDEILRLATNGQLRLQIVDIRLGAGATSMSDALERAKR